MSELFDYAPPVAQRAVMGGKPVLTVPSKTIINFDSGFKHKLLCDGPTFSTGSACQYSCEYCYVPDIMKKLLFNQGIKEKHEDVVIRRANAVNVVRSQLLSRGKPKFRADVNDRRVIYASPLVDVASNLDLANETVEVCAVILELTNWQIRLLSKSTLLPKVAQGLSERLHPQVIRQRMIFGVSTGTLDDKLGTVIETGTPKVSKRIQSLYWLQDNGYRTFGMICPSLPQTDYRKFATDLADAIQADKCEHVWAECINVRGESFTRTIKALQNAGLQDEAERLTGVSNSKPEWEAYARSTFQAHAEIYKHHTGPDGLPKLRFLQYVTNESRPWWQREVRNGAVLL